MFTVDKEHLNIHTPQDALKYFYGWRSQWKYKEPINVLRIEPRQVFVIFYKIKRSD